MVLAAFASAAVGRADTGTNHVKVDLLADVSAVQPGKPFTLGVRFRIDPGWHIYWTNPGDSGLPTRVKLDLPPGLTAGATEYPVPSILTFPGDITNYGYEREVVLLVPVTPTAALTAVGSAHIVAHIDYLVCDATCLPGSAVLSIDLPESTQSAPANGPLFAEARYRMPRLATDPAAAVVRSKATFGHGGATVSADVAWRGTTAPAAVTWIPDVLPAAWELDNLAVRFDAGHTTVSFGLTPLAKGAPLPPQVDGLLISTSTDGRRTGYVFPIRVTAGSAHSPTGS